MQLVATMYPHPSGSYIVRMTFAPQHDWDDPVEIQRGKEKHEIRMRYVNAFIRPKEK